MLGTTKAFANQKELSYSGHTHSASNITSGILTTTRGGTGITSNPSMLVNLSSTSAASVFASSPRPGITGTLPVSKGGTGVTSLDELKNALGLHANGCIVEIGSYVGDGRYGIDQYITLELSISPFMILVKKLNSCSCISSTYESFVWLFNETTIVGSSFGNNICELNGTTFKWSGSGQHNSSSFSARTVFNDNNETYQYIAFGI